MAAAKLPGMNDVPCLRFEYMTEAEKRAYVIVDNRLGFNAGWDEGLLAVELGAQVPHDLEFDIGLTRFSIAEIDTLMDAVAPEEECDPADEAVPYKAPARVCPGSIWPIGRHRVICGDALDAQVIASLMGGETATMVFSDPPYNVPMHDHVDNSGRTQHREFAKASHG